MQFKEIYISPILMFKFKVLQIFYVVIIIKKSLYDSLFKYILKYS